MSKKSCTKENSFYARYIKRILDIVCAMLVLICFWWLYIICAVVIVADSGFPVVYSKKRSGKNGKAFVIYKFRTMVKNADKIGPSSTSTGDSRITKCGKWLRKTSLDEIPQIINILKGDMSFVGFRPDVVHEGETYENIKYLLRPGVVGFAQVNGRSSIGKDEKIYWEEKYSYEVSFFTDVKIIIQAVGVVLKGSGTN